MALPFILAGAALLAGGIGVKKGIDAKEDFDRAERIGRRAKRNHEDAIESLESEREKTNQSFQDLGRLKVGGFKSEVQHPSQIS